MTTIAWDGELLAADSAAITAGTRNDLTKVFRLRCGLFGFAGAYQQGLLVRNWLEATDAQLIHSTGYPNPERLDDFSGLFIDEQGRCFHLQSLCLGILIADRSFYAIGSGREYAMLAMHYGKTAPEAIADTMLFDAYTGGHVDSVRLRK